jgi:Na+/citrate or Na+/malate symporter
MQRMILAALFLALSLIPILPVSEGGKDMGAVPLIYVYLESLARPFSTYAFSALLPLTIHVVLTLVVFLVAKRLYFWKRS